MPESREEEGSFFLFNDTFQPLKDKTSFKLIGLHADASNREQKQYNAQDGHVIRLTPDCDIVRGTSGSQTSIFPAQFASTAENPNPRPLTDLTLQGAHSANRAIILDFGTYFLKVSYIMFIYHFL